jgi:hypothetical protein
VSGPKENVIELAKHVWAQHTAYEHAMQTRGDSNAEVLKFLIKSVLPALPAIVGGVHGGVDLDVASGQASANGNLWIDDSGFFFSVHAGSTEFPDGAKSITYDEAANVWGVGYIANALTVLFQGQLNGKKSKRTAELIQERDRLQAVATLLRGIS